VRVVVAVVPVVPVVIGGVVDGGDCVYILSQDCPSHRGNRKERGNVLLPDGALVHCIRLGARFAVKRFGERFVIAKCHIHPV